MNMERINRICAHPLWRESVEQIGILEQDRRFCRHDIAHFLDTARIAYIENLERGLGISKEQIYAAALLHDIGRHLQYREGIPHHRGSAMLARRILTECGFDAAESDAVLSAIRQHRNPEARFGENLAGLIFRADKQSRNCLFCSASEECSWSDDKKNLILTV